MKTLLSSRVLFKVLYISSSTYMTIAPQSTCPVFSKISFTKKVHFTRVSYKVITVHCYLIRSCCKSQNLFILRSIVCSNIPVVSV